MNKIVVNLKSTLIAMLSIFVMLSIVGCTSKETEKKLDGAWVAEYTQKESGQDVYMILRMDLNARSHKANLEVDLSMDGMPSLCTVNLDGEWRATPDELKIKLDDSDTDVEFGEQIKSLASSMNVNLKSLEDKLRDAALGKFENEDGILIFEISKLNKHQLVLRIEEETYKFQEDDGTITSDRYGKKSVSAVAPAKAPVSAVSAPDNGHYSLNGSIGKYPIHLEMDLGSGGRVTGRYRYTKSGSGDWLVITGTATGSGSKNVVLYEYNDKGEQTGYFDGTLSGSSYSGQFINYKGTSYNFYLN